MITKVDLKNHLGYYFTYDPDDISVPIKFYSMWKQYGQNPSVLTENVHTEIKQHKTAGGYWRIQIRYSNGIRKIVPVHRLVAMNLIENPFNLETVDHIDNNKNNNHPSNLQWMTSSYNSKKNAFTNEKSAARTRTYEIHFTNGQSKVVHCLKDFSRDSKGYYNYHCLCKLSQKKNKTHKNITSVQEVI